jgi:hypothetical protein
MNARAPAQSTPPPLPHAPEPSMATRLWLGTRSAAPPAPPSPSRFAAAAVTFPSRRPPFWRTALLVFVSASIGALGAVLAQALLHGSDWLPRLARASSMLTSTGGDTEPALRGGASMPTVATPAPIVLGGAEHPREIVLRIRIEGNAADDTPTMVIDPDEARAEMLEASAAPTPAADAPTY